MLDKIYMKIAWWLPKRLVYWSFIRLTVYSMAQCYDDNKTPDEVNIRMVLDEWRKQYD